ncbi:FecR family protein [Sphaerotilus sp.]|uniref:FecR family protein n=1 Tax=Sphaerotilus sp. TaxID=2093942 RepID=UPI002ACD8D48|nr:FecR domain-containing protein [Sphaerotilus sp.]MDZ7855800.1 FecR domain-containing protein [Sphaerotilus sp.]
MDVSDAAGATPVPEALLERALTLLARRDGADAAGRDKAASQLRRWSEAGAEHRRALQQAEQLWGGLGNLAAASRDAISLPAADDRLPPARADRRRALSRLGGGTALGLAALAGLGLWRWHGEQALFDRRFATGIGQLMPGVTLPDGSTLALDADSAVELSLWRNRREARLLHGRALFTVASDAGRPFTVFTRAGEVRVVGTRFSVSDRGGAVRVLVAEGRVQVRSGPEQALLRAGQQIELRSVDASDTEPGAQPWLGPVRPASVEDAAAWRSGWLSFNDTPLAEAVAAFNAYLQHPIELAEHPRLRALRVSGGFDARAPKIFVESLPAVLPVRVERGPLHYRVKLTNAGRGDSGGR